jgi:hypothetical protein
MIRTYDRMDTHEMTREVYYGNSQTSDDCRLTDVDHVVIHLAAEKFRMPRHIPWSEAGMMVFGGLCVLGMVWIVVWGW